MKLVWDQESRGEGLQTRIVCSEDAAVACFFKPEYTCTVCLLTGGLGLTSREQEKPINQSRFDVRPKSPVPERRINLHGHTGPSLAPRT
mmetsp:Transcript_12433/g.24144  ORF Transcript_12433/g.24144 Transcript_12433/m.24144 type:complete len:89 (-) Transcript_12433:87-353(-)